MAEGMNKAILIGNLGADPKLRYAGDQPVLNMRLATTESYKDKDGERKENTQWHNVALWGKRAEALEKFLAKGSRICVEGRIETRSYEKDGEKRYATSINATNVVLLDSKRDGEERGGRSEDRGGRDEGRSRSRDEGRSRDDRGSDRSRDRDDRGGRSEGRGGRDRDDRGSNRDRDGGRESGGQESDDIPF